MHLKKQHQAINTVIFDLGGVLIDWNPRYLYRKIFGSDVDEMERFLTEVCNSAWNERQDVGRSWNEAMDEAVALHPDKRELIKIYRERWEEMLGGPIQETVAILEELRARGIRLLALTNWANDTFSIAREHYPFLSWFEGIVVSGVERVMKPDPAIFKLLITRFGIDTARAVFIDDNPRNVTSANISGLCALQFSNAHMLRRDLKVLGLPLQPVKQALP